MNNAAAVSKEGPLYVYNYVRDYPTRRAAKALQDLFVRFLGAMPLYGDTPADAASGLPRQYGRWRFVVIAHGCATDAMEGSNHSNLYFSDGTGRPYTGRSPKDNLFYTLVEKCGGAPANQQVGAAPADRYVPAAYDPSAGLHAPADHSVQTDDIVTVLDCSCGAANFSSSMVDEHVAWVARTFGPQTNYTILRDVVRLFA